MWQPFADAMSLSPYVCKASFTCGVLRELIGTPCGYSGMIENFLQAVRDGRPTASDDILATHRLCEEIVRHAEQAGGQP